MARRLVTLAFVISVLLSVASGVLWLKGYTNQFWVQTSPPGAVYAFKIWDGEASLYRIDPAPSRSRAVLLEFPVGRMFIVTGVAAMLIGAWMFRPHKAPPGLCSYCGYDLRASTGRCPECGRSIPDKVFA